MSTLACVLGAIPSEDRSAHFARVGRLFREVALTRQKEPNGYAFSFPSTELDEVSRFVSLERRCCPFLSFSIDVEAEDGPIYLRVSGPPGSRELIEAELLT
jgi:hypothetical protein